MAICLFDENLSPNVAGGLAQIGFDVLAIGGQSAPARGSSDLENIKWCTKRDAVLFTSDRGRKDKEILQVLNRFTGAHVVFVPEAMTGPELSSNFHKRIDAIDDLLARGRRVRKKITNQGGWIDAK